MNITLRRVSNGYIVKDNEEEGGPEFVFAEDLGVQAFAEFLCWLNFEYGPSTSRYDKERIYIEVKPGDKYEDIFRLSSPFITPSENGDDEC